ncbi:MAG: insulinase family protein [Bacteroidetes bacterium]|nr:insulinase family protein [Bacteroidota bacterium]
MEFQEYALPSGIKCILKKIKSPVVYSSLTVNVGTRDEEINEHGIAHLIEHMMFKGTKKRKIFHINSLLDNVGGELNAFTTKEETVVHATTLKRDFSKAIDLISDVFFNSIYPEKEFSKELGVIIDEINAYKDSPSELIFDDFEDIIFAGSSLGRNILGTKKQLKKISRNDIINFRNKNYSTDKMIFAVVGDITFNRFKQLCDKFLGSIEANHNTTIRATIPEYTRIDKVIDKRTYQTHCLIGGRSVSYDNKARIPLALLVNMLGGSSANSRLSSLLREKHGLTYNVEANLTTYQETGLVSIYFSADKNNTERCRELIDKELQTLMTTELTKTQLHMAQRQLIGQMTIASESIENYMLSSARSYMLYGNVLNNEELTKKVFGITASDIMDVANLVFNKNNLSTLTYK